MGIAATWKSGSFIFKRLYNKMSDVPQFHSLRQLCIRLPISLYLSTQQQYQARSSCLQRHALKLTCSLLAMLFSTTVHAQCPIQFEYPPTPAQSQASAESSDDTLQQDVRASIAAQKNGNCQSAKLFQKRTLSKEDLQELRRVVREHAQSRPLHSAASVKH